MKTVTVVAVIIAAFVLLPAALVKGILITALALTLGVAALKLMLSEGRAHSIGEDSV